MLELSDEAVKWLWYLAPGFVAFRVYTIDSDWEKVSLLNVFYGSVVFASLTYVIFDALESGNKAQFPTAIRVFLLVFIPLTLAIAWKGYGHVYFHRVLQTFNITNEDNSGSAWEKIFNDPNVRATQITVTLKSGESYMCDNTYAKFPSINEKKGIYPYYTDATGAISFIATHKKTWRYGSWEELPDPDTAEWGARIIFIPKESIEHAFVRVLNVQ